MKLVNTELKTILNDIETKLKDKSFDLQVQKQIFGDLIENQTENLEGFLEEAQNLWDQFQSKNQNYIIKKTYTSFFYSHFDKLFKQYISLFFGLNKNSLELKSKEKLSDKNLLLEYQYTLSNKEINLFNKFSDNVQDSFYGLEFLIGYSFLFTSLFGMKLREIIDEEIFIMLDGAIFTQNEDKTLLNFLIVIKESKDQVYENYLKMVLFYFLKKFKEIPENYCDYLLEGREKLYQIAQDQYTQDVKENLVNLLYYFYKKCKLLNNISPLLDFLNFVGSRVEDSKFSKKEIIQSDFLDNFDYSKDKKTSILRLFDFLDKKSSLFCTFQANNLPSPKLQVELFLLYMTYYFGSGLEGLELGQLLYLPEEFKEALNRYNLSDSHAVIGSKTINYINQFINYFSPIASSNCVDLFFKRIFHRSVYDLNYWFFRTFLKSFNEKLRQLIEKENVILNENEGDSPLTFDMVVDHICRILYTLIEKIFLRDNPEEASENFNDPLGRYIGKNIALRVLELQIFEDINFSDDIWPEYLISLNKDKINKDIQKYEDFNIPDKYFYSTQDLVRFLITYNFKSSSIESYFEEWFIKAIISPLNEFILLIRNRVDDLRNKIEVYETLVNFFIKNPEKHSEEEIKEVKNICQKLSQFWKLLA